jgi:VanZ family protein
LDAGTALERPVQSAHSNEAYYFTLRAIAASANIKHRLRAGAKACCVPIVVLLVIAALGPEKWAPRTHLGWQFDHFIGYFGITLFVCVGWPRPFVVGGVFAAIAALLEGLQAFTPDRSAYLPAIFYGAAGALAAALVAELVARVRNWLLRREVNVRQARSKSLAFTGSANLDLKSVSLRTVN